MKKLTCVLCVFVLVSALVAPAAAMAANDGINYTALGDSIAVGVGGTDGVGYVDLLAGHLERVHGDVTLVEMSASGMTSGDLLTVVGTVAEDPTRVAALSEADIITISIGGNDILQPVLAYVAWAPANVPGWEYMTPEQKLVVAQTYLVPLLQAAVAAFPENWAHTMAIIRSVNPTAEIHVNALYNPFKPGDGHYEIADPFIQGINQTLYAFAPILGYEVIDAYSAFGAYGNPKKPAVWDLTSPVALHPTDVGYKFMFNLNKDALAVY